MHPVLASTLAARLARLGTLIDEEEQLAIAKVAGGQTLHGLTADLATSVDPDAHATRAAEVFDLPLATLLDPRSYRLTTRNLRGTDIELTELHYERHVIWGATAGILQSLRELLQEPGP